MSPLVRLWLYKQKATIRNLYRKPTSAIFTTLMILVYGFIFLNVFQLGTMDPKQNLVQVQQLILLGIGFNAIIVSSMLLQKRKALFMIEDSFYLFSGPFSREQIMRYLMSQTFLQSFLFSLISMFMVVSFGATYEFSLLFIFLLFLGNALILFFFLVLVDYIYILSITDKKYKKYSKIIVAVIVVFALGLFTFSLAQNNFNIKSGLVDFAQNEMFYAVPVFGWVKLLLVSCIQENYMMCLLALALIFGAIAILYFFFIKFKGDFYEQALMDSQELSEYVKQVRAGKQNAMNLNAKVKSASVKFLPGAGAIFSKNILIMKKTRDFIRVQEVVILVVYFAISVFTDLGFGMFMYMLIIWVFQLLQTSDLVRELKNYQIYLIPAKPFGKLMYALLPTLIKISIVLGVAILGSGLYYGMGFMVIIQYLITLFGYTCVLVSGTVLSTRILKSRTNMMAESLLRMFVIVLCAIPSVLLIVYFIMHEGRYDDSIMQAISICSLAMNILISLFVIYICKGMMNGREISSD